ncbi:MAG: hypothetical protein WB729_14445 [Candidatus Sulfotelmatobacter sp.]
MLPVTVSAAVLSAAVYVGDFAVFRFRVVLNRNPYDSVTVQRFDAVLKKNGRTQFLFDPPQPERCVKALFPHQGFAPCWYLNRHREQGTNI